MKGGCSCGHFCQLKMLQLHLIPTISFCIFAKKGVEESVAESRLMGKQTLGEKQIIAPSPTVEHSVHFVDIFGKQIFS